jgi:hypothetical protein
MNIGQSTFCFQGQIVVVADIVIIVVVTDVDGAAVVAFDVVAGVSVVVDVTSNTGTLVAVAVGVTSDAVSVVVVVAVVVKTVKRRHHLISFFSPKMNRQSRWTRLNTFKLRGTTICELCEGVNDQDTIL